MVMHDADDHPSEWTLRLHGKTKKRKGLAKVINLKGKKSRRKTRRL